MSTIHSEILSWNPLVLNSFVSIWGTRLKTYNVDTEKMIHLGHFLNLPSQGTCCAWSPSYLNKLCVGSEQGSIYLIDTKEGKIQKEFKSEKSKTKCVQWNQTNSHLIAHGLDKSKGYPGLLIWDINDGPKDRSHHPRDYSRDTREQHSVDSTGESSIVREDTNYGPEVDFQSNHSHDQPFRSNLSVHSASSSYRASMSGVSQHSSIIQMDGDVAETVRKPVFESLGSESVFSVAWIPNAPMSLLAGTYKQIRLVDIRDVTSRSKGSKTVSGAHSKNVLGLEFNPFDHNYFASFGLEESIIKVWDMRNLTSPILKREVATSVSNNKINSIVHIEWSICVKNELATLTSEGDCVKIWNISLDKKHEVSLPYKHSMYRAVYLSSDDNQQSENVENELIKTFSLSHTQPYRVLIGTSSKVSLVKLESQPPIFSVSPIGDKVASFDGKKLDLLESKNLEKFDEKPNNKNLGYRIRGNEDISEIMQLRAIKKIGMDFHHNLQITREIADKVTLPLWEWGSRMKKLNILNDKESETQFEYIGILSILNHDPKKSSIPFLSITKNISNQYREALQTLFKTYLDDKRLVTITLCWWEEEETQSNTSKKLSERDAAIAIFRFNLELAGNILTKLDNGNNNYGMLAFAILGFSEERRHFFRNASSSLSNPYLRAAFRFLSSDGNDFLSILDEKNIRLSDRIAIACMYLPDDKLHQYVKQQATIATKQGDLEGILLTGLNRNGFNLMQNYVNNTNDIQTACLAFSHVVPLKYENDQVERWLHAYRDLLDMWQFWEIRAMLDTTLTMYTKSTIQNKNPGVVIRCAYCSHALREGLQPKSFSRPGFPSRPSYTNSPPSATSCPNCKKILPKCSICLTPYGTSMLSLGEDYELSSNPMTKLNYCFAWCRNCKHGGHVIHLLEWFSRHEECPVSGCSCCCNVGNPTFRAKERYT